MKKLINIVVILLCIFLQGCAALHYQNQKGMEAKGKNFQTKVGTIEKGKGHFWSEIDLWVFFPWKVRVPYECENLPVVQP